MTPNEITTLIATGMDKELDMAFKKQLWERVKYWRSTLIKQSLDRNPGDSKFFRQTIFMDMRKINELACGDEGMECYVAETVDKVPMVLRTSASGIFDYVGGIDGNSPFGYADSGTLHYLKAGKYAQLSLFKNYRFQNNRVRVTEIPALPKIRIDGIFDNPEEAMPYATCAAVDHSCDWWNTDVPMSSDIAQRIVQSILSVDYNRLSQPDDHQIQLNANNS